MVIQRVLLVLIVSLAINACDKNKRASKRLIKSGTWDITELSVDGSNVAPLPIWVVETCDIYEELCTATWLIDEKESFFNWQFNEEAETFTIVRLPADEDKDSFYTEEVELMTYRFSGEYKVIESKRKRKIFESFKTIGYEGKKVVITLENY